MKNKTENTERYENLAMVRWGGNRYFVDFKLKQFIQVDNPTNIIGFDTEFGKQICDKTFITECPYYCGDSDGPKKCSTCQNLGCFPG